MPEGMEVSFELGEFKEELADKYDMLILSPGISIHHYFDIIIKESNQSESKSNE